MMKTHLLPALILMIGLILVACSPQVAESATGSDMDQMSNKEVLDVIEDDHTDVQMSDDMAEDRDEMSGHTDDSMVKDEGEMMDKSDEDMEMKEDEISGEGEIEGSEVEIPDDDTSMEDKSMSDEMMMTSEWFKVSLKNARTGEEFTISDFNGKVVLVETMAMWCSNCFKQQGQVKSLHSLLGDREDFISLGIDIDPNENAEALKSYIDNNGFDWLYTVAQREVAREIGQLYGNQFLNPPSTPMLIIDRHGEVHTLPFGIKSAESLLDSLQPFLDDNI
jgi:hypothetical protein